MMSRLRRSYLRLDLDPLLSVVLFQILTKDSVTVFVNAIMYYKVIERGKKAIFIKQETRNKKQEHKVHCTHRLIIVLDALALLEEPFHPN